MGTLEAAIRVVAVIPEAAGWGVVEWAAAWADLAVSGSIGAVQHGLQPYISRFLCSFSSAFFSSSSLCTFEYTASN